MSKPTAKPAEVADYDSDESRIVSGTEVSAKTTSKRRPLERSSSKATRHPDHPSRTAVPSKSASDSGYSSTPAAAAGPKTATAAATQSAVTTSPQKATAATSAKGKPIIHRADSARSTTRSATVSHSTAKRKDCRDSTCQHTECESTRDPDRRYTNPHRTSMPPLAPPPPPAHYTYQQQYDYTAMPPPSALSRPRADSISRQRPQSFHAPAMPYVSAQSGPPPSASAYYGYPQASYGQAHPGYASTPANQSLMYPPPSTAPAVQPTPSSPLTSTYPGFPGHTTARYSARTGNPAVPGLANSIPMPPPAPAYSVATGTSARGDHRAATTKNRRSRADEYTSSESSSSDEESYDEEPRYERFTPRETKRISYEPARSKSRRRGSNVVLEDSRSRRPPTQKYHTTSEVPTRKGSNRGSSSRPDLAYRPRSDPSDHHQSSSEHYDSGTTSKAAVGDRKYSERRNAVDRHSRRPSVASSYDTPPTSLSSGTAYAAHAIVEDKYGRRRVYLSKEQVDALTQRREREEGCEGQRDLLEERLLHQDRMERYQKDMAAGAETYQKEMAAGIERQNLTATNIKQANRRSTMSHVSGRSHKSTTSSSKVSRGGGLMIESNGTVLYLEEGIPELSLKAEDGGTRIVIGSGTGRETSYNDSRSSGSRIGRPRTSRSQTLHDEGGYEKDY
ncbi:hypothetical protein CERZMDRAFT_94939 [Cercospora zeae-maydis SCOH1-5]|uniref:Uncharacterized protein n=1 Tax=Cercospora zeae-maydis SCOH1-5 TaxID=717836 RepID=A0A6A6FQ82_9PEZI|nr:hypothetical protein CERZMDRAFT_94939 [Cercospora zeae-maydis SCOH1-5]